jgi:uncharacterized protein YjiS (DUF1127 family)
MTEITFSGHHSPSQHARPTLAFPLAKKGLEVLREWRRRYRSRQELAQYSYHEREDLPFSDEVDAEIAKPFWKR